MNTYSLPKLPYKVDQQFLDGHQLTPEHYQQLLDPKLYACVDKDGSRVFVKREPVSDGLAINELSNTFSRPLTTYETCALLLITLFLVAGLGPLYQHWVYTTFRAVWIIGFFFLASSELTRHANALFYAVLWVASAYLMITSLVGGGMSIVHFDEGQWRVIDVVYAAALWRAAYTHSYRDSLERPVRLLR